MKDGSNRGTGYRTGNDCDLTGDKEGCMLYVKIQKFKDT